MAETTQRWSGGGVALVQEGLPPCLTTWVPPAGQAMITYTLDLHVETEANLGEIVEVRIEDMNVSDALLDECVRAYFQGERLAMPGVAGGQRARLRWPFYVSAGAGPGPSAP